MELWYVSFLFCVLTALTFYKTSQRGRKCMVVSLRTFTSFSISFEQSIHCMIIPIFFFGFSFNLLSSF